MRRKENRFLNNEILRKNVWSEVKKFKVGLDCKTERSHSAITHSVFRTSAIHALFSWSVDH